MLLLPDALLGVLSLPIRSQTALPVVPAAPLQRSFVCLCDFARLPRLRCHAMQDSLSQELRASSSVRDSSFSFRLRRALSAPPHLRWVYGHVYCRCRHDERLRRGAEQRSVVLLSWLPLGSVLEPLARLAGPAVLSHGPQALRQVGAPPAPLAGMPRLLAAQPAGQLQQPLQRWLRGPRVWLSARTPSAPVPPSPPVPALRALPDRCLRRCSSGPRWSGGVAWTCPCWGGSASACSCRC